MIDLRYVKKLVELLDGSSVDSIEISSDKGMKIRISKTPQQRGVGIATTAAPVQVAVPMTTPTLIPAAMPAARMTPADGVPATMADSATPAPVEPPKPKLLEVKSPMVGTFYRSPEPGSPSYVSEGSRIAKGEILCIIEAMKIMNEIESEYAGIVREVLVSDAHPVEYGQVLFRIDPNG
ncbi:MAG TPA: acetyl-CoA carboxylase biotin carboxyl carrier protein [Gemmatimonadaceae bacterium]|nr:acetyl-CoA carboxylase biotin carboxyl carrier protein [Gemmatimonadaceae bacterium]